MSVSDWPGNQGIGKNPGRIISSDILNTQTSSQEVRLKKPVILCPEATSLPVKASDYLIFW